jgi:hypothetical protein
MINPDSFTQQCILTAFVDGEDIPDGLKAEMFTGLYRKAFETILRLKRKGFVVVPIDTIIHGGEFGIEESERIKEFGKLSTLVGLNLPIYVKELEECYKKQKAWERVTQLKEKIENDLSLSVDDLATELTNLGTVSVESKKADRGISFAELLKKEFPPDIELIQGLIGLGLTVLTGASKIGKSWYALQLVTALDQGGYFLGQLKLEYILKPFF